MSIELMMPSNHLILCHPLLLPPSILPSIRVFSNESVLLIRWPKYWSFHFSISPSNEHSGLMVPSGLTGLISLLSKGLSTVFSNTTVQKLIIREMQIKTTNHTPVRMAIIKKFTNNKCWRRCGDKGILLHSCEKCKLT